jgi:hypothetical protein
MNAEYLFQFEQAQIFTKEMGLECPEFVLEPELDFTQRDREDLINAILYEVYTRSKLRVEDLASKCFWKSQELKSFLKERFDLNSVVTSGYLYSSGFTVYHEAKESIRERLTNHCRSDEIKFHTWVTLTNHLVLDLTLPPTMWMEQMAVGIQAPKEDAKKMAWYDYRITPKKICYYEPVFLGYEYFTKINVKPRLHLLFKDNEEIE